MNSVLRIRLIALAAVVMALLAGWQLSYGAYWLAGPVAALAIAFALNRLSGVPPDAFVGGLVVVGYLVANRGFAQLSVPGYPLLPAEFALLLAVPAYLWHAASTKSIPFRKDALNWALVAFLTLGAARMPFDLIRYGVIALRDFALFYYALFFFISQQWASQFASRRWIERCFSVGFCLTLPMFAAFRLWPDFFETRLTLFDVPLVYIKGDVACGFMVAGLFWYLDAYSKKRRLYQLVIAAMNLGGALLCNSRAAVVALAFCVAALLGFWFAFRASRTIKLLGILGAAGIAALAIEAVLPRPAGETSQLFRIYESALTTVDLSGNYVPQTSSLDDKADNNAFRYAWWRAVIDETVEEAPWIGLGFGHDLAERFIISYYPDNNEEFNVRSPHNVLISIFARTGVVGISVMLVVLGAMVTRTLRDARTEPNGEPNAAWIGSWGILVTACFGVVLEGPMGAVVFWMLLGFANGRAYPVADSREDEAVLKP